jgi:phage tail sheath protein FI
MIKQASDLKDRFALIDPFQVTPKNTADPNGDIDADSKVIRDSVLKEAENRYAAAYYPFLKTLYEYKYDFDNLKVDVYNHDAGVTDQALTGLQLNDAKIGTASALYAKIKSEISKQYVVLPPSPAMAGIYTRVDNTKGVWKAPANESVISVAGPDLAISDREQQNLNVDSLSGKSINAIRTFPGYGTLVWGARTLNGNDNEWRYISVRRFFNMVEESVKKSSQVFVFEPNTISTWVKVQAMIENYLFLKWREGALAGSKPEQAYFVRVGLGSTMTSLDILEGRMNVEIGMAVARPAEFIILKFSQMMQQS